ncbi:MAG: hypothetical protein JWN75_39 [Candidatus Saccharibacteria bacterium]|nr:hypothetical protein [Candidatus Saccharibacteria bacterium]
MTTLLSAEQIRKLVRRIGNRDVVATLAGCSDPLVINKWINGSVEPDPQQCARLVFTQQWSSKIMSDQTFRLWLNARIKLPNRPGTISSAEAIGCDHSELVVGAARHIYNIQY